MASFVETISFEDLCCKLFESLAVSNIERKHDHLKEFFNSVVVIQSRLTHYGMVREKEEEEESDFLFFVHLEINHSYNAPYRC